MLLQKFPDSSSSIHGDGGLDRGSAWVGTRLLRVELDSDYKNFVQQIARRRRRFSILE